MAKRIEAVSYELKTGCGDLHILINFKGKDIVRIIPVMGKAGGCASAQLSAIGDILTLAFKEKIDCERIVKVLGGIYCMNTMGIGDDKVTSCSDAIAQAIKLFMEEKKGLT